MALTKLHEERGQMTVELCVVFPVVIVIAVIAMNVLVFFGDCAALDRSARNAACVLAASPSTKESLPELAARIGQAVSQEMGSEQVECTAQGGEDGLSQFTVTYTYEPTLFGMGLRSEVWGVPLPKLTHSTELTLDVYSPRDQVSVEAGAP